jgi:protein-S-isoprenylcysteine O-methyltransferase Ste14
MADDMKQRFDRALATGRRGIGASLEDIVVALLVAAPFAGTFGLWLSALTWWPNPAIWAATAVVLAASALWIAGRGVGVAEAQE